MVHVSRICLLCNGKGATSYHKFPKDPAIRLQWMEICNLDSKIDTNLNSVVLCSKHFSTEDFSNSQKNLAIDLRLRLHKKAVPSLNLTSSGILPCYNVKEPGVINSGCPRKHEDSMPIEPLEESAKQISTTSSSSTNRISIKSTHYLKKYQVESVNRCCACMKLLTNELYSAPVTMVCFDDKTVKDCLQLFLVPLLTQKEDDMDLVAIKDEDFVCDACLIVLRNTMKFVKNCLQIREKMKEELRDEKCNTQIQKIRRSQVVETVPDVNHCSFLPLQFSEVPDHDEIISFQDAVPQLLISLQKSGVSLLQNCKSYDNFYKNKRVLLVGNKAYVGCRLCEQRFDREEQMLEHLTEVHGLTKAFLVEPILHEYEPSESNECPGCSKVFSSVRHKKIHLSKCMMFICSYCDQMFNWSKLAEHTKREHGDPNPFKCFKCKLEKSSYYAIKSHICNGRKCEDCGKTYFYENKLAEHKKNFCRLKSCRECKKKISISLYDKHMEMHNVPCPKCGMVFQSRYALRKHVNRHKTRLCPICGKVYKVLSSHLLIHNENRIKNISCSQCPKLFYKMSELRLHVKQAHESKMIVCEVCGEQVRDCFMKKHCLTKHATKEYKCGTCSKSFTNVREYKHHVRSHTGTLEVRSVLPLKTKKYDFRKNEPVVCKHCLKSFKNLVYLRIHMKSHTKSSRVRCRYCAKTYANVNCRWKHEIQHHKAQTEKREKMVLPGIIKKTIELNLCTCEVCGELFKDMDQLNSHLEADHNVMSESGPVVSELAKEVLLGFEALDYDDSLFLREESEVTDNVEIIHADDEDSYF